VFGLVLLPSGQVDLIDFGHSAVPDRMELTAFRLGQRKYGPSSI
jgi:hypothetical protein